MEGIERQRKGSGGAYSAIKGGCETMAGKGIVDVAGTAHGVYWKKKKSSTFRCYCGWHCARPGQARGKGGKAGKRRGGRREKGGREGGREGGR